ncbi:MAG TPA: hypothetical protein VG346_15485 [Acidimicrobiales bacterium]|nr:hypothetical protein [Acidimicrobiales bacterium]
MTTPSLCVSPAGNQCVPDRSTGWHVPCGPTPDGLPRADMDALGNGKIK